MDCPRYYREYLCVFYFQNNKLKLIAAIVAEQKLSEQNKLSFRWVTPMRWQRLYPA